jgi:RimJ/RimL family protein N-acetyltransferase
MGTLIATAREHRVGTAIGVFHPDTTEFARMWSTSTDAWDGQHAVHWAATNSGDARIQGYAGLALIDQERSQAELRAWVGNCDDHWSYAAEWCSALLQYAFHTLKLKRVYALQLARQPVAGHVLADIGMRRDGLLRKRIHRERPFEDMFCWTALQTEWAPTGQAPS